MIKKVLSNKVKFIILGMGSKRRKFVYIKGGKLIDALTLEIIKKWEIEKEEFDLPNYYIKIYTKKNKEIIIYEDEKGIWLKEEKKIEPLTKGEHVNLPDFKDNPYKDYLKVLHAEILVNITYFGPVPNLWVYPKPWYRDAAMALMCLNLTNNLHLVENWVMGLERVFDLNNENEEPDNIGQVLYMVSLYEKRKHPIIEKAIRSMKKFIKNSYICGLTDGIEHPVYQTKWIKFGLKSLGLDDSFLKIPKIKDKYSSIFWMDFKDQHIECEGFSEFSQMNYPYLAWAEAHFYHNPPPQKFETFVIPLTWESKASKAEYWKLQELGNLCIIQKKDVFEKIARPHIWHAAEMFLYLYYLKKGGENV